MKLKIHENCFVRQIGDTSVFWCPRNGSSLIVENFGWIAERLGTHWISIDALIKEFAEKISSPEEEIRSDTLPVIKELINNGFLLCNEKWNSEEMRGANDAAALLETDFNEFNPLDDYYKKAGLPSSFHLDLTDACTERCVHCYIPHGRHTYLPYEWAEKAISEYRDINGLTIYLTGGECMLHKDFERVCQLCRKKNLNIVILSNLTCCNDETIEFLKVIDPQYINVSLYSMDPSEHDAITQMPGSWKKTMDAIRACDKAGVHCRIATPLLKINRDAFPALKEFADKHHMHLIPCVDIIARTDHSCANLTSVCSAEDVCNVMRNNRGLFDRYNAVEKPARNAKVCDIGNARLYLNAQGNYYPCDSMHDYILGNVCENTFEEVWRGAKLDYLRSLKNLDFVKCANCDHRPWCKVCPAANFNATGDLFALPNGYCELAKTMQKVYG